MGGMLQKPVVSTVVERQSSKSFTVAVAELNGYRQSMEDAHLIDLRDDWGFFGVFDGHGGVACSKYVAKSLGEKLLANGCPADDEAVKQLILQVDQEFLDSAQESGSTATMCIVHKPVNGGKHKLRIANAGDSRILLGRRDGTIVDGGGTDKGLTRDHKPSDASEQERIYRCGGDVQFPGGVARVNGDLAVSRGFGDAEYKKSGGPAPEDRPVTANPELGHFECDGSDFLLLVCDGVSEGDFSNEEVVQTVAKCLEENDDPAFAAKAVCHKAVARNSKDNVTCMVVLLDGSTSGPEKAIEFTPGPLSCMDNRGFMTAYESMAERAGLTLVQAIEKRYLFLQDVLKDVNDAAKRLNLQPPDDDVSQLKLEAEKLGEAPGTRGSAEWNEFFEGKAERPKEGESGGETGGIPNLMRMLAQHPNPSEMLQRMGVPMRKVKVTDLDTLTKAVEAHPSLAWDARMEQLAGQEGHATRVDDSDGTTNVRFPAPINLVVWLPSDCLTDA
eukprot:TRINITY_DN55492_c0_g1_i1.p1 TRINITY_DN55492_c0_g1~~TRINITY_DN55492_c0_g1_i1.p1  ORF type:complete len:501 (-),score=99.05 TRINITY_DN55492_c0_g1_i1:72-1574(-)